MKNKLAPEYFYLQTFETPLGAMQVGANIRKLYYLQFVCDVDSNEEVENIARTLNLEITHQTNSIIELTKNEVLKYFAKKLKNFSIPLGFIGTPFQIQTWNAITQIPYGEAISYKQLAKKVDKPNGYRAVANVNAKNKIVVIVPCHRVIAHDQTIGGYSGGLDRKKLLLDLEEIKYKK
ncbi:methylated-DNA--[protein]-cysteine S-methyltransferase [[Mycoplasma] testudinis]|uniref:methylated-DNA--[protein]-cysteine S-methyltransferase n=1 Tax=[Mycoplasma] testudinis TaxID=33924 RepID=UPI0004802890|nr:methylated-DNA--[protein]-cysteine S-methyltransferase [[Mycoplasma] testudinis]